LVVAERFVDCDWFDNSFEGEIKRFGIGYIASRLLRRIQIIAGDFWGLVRVCGPWIALRWLVAIVIRFPECRRAGNLQPADAWLGDGPITVRKGRARAKLTCFRVLTGIRETWVRDEYLGNGFLHIAPDATVVDLGSNMGGFTTLALAHGAQVRVVAVEADPLECRRLQKTLAINGWTDRVTIVNAFIGGRTRMQDELSATERGGRVPTITQAELLELAGNRVSLLKCDIEGSEFELCAPPTASATPLLAAAEQIAMEVHPHAGEARRVIEYLKSLGFELNIVNHPPTLMVLGRRAVPRK
jgi:FkbM family methyltransferase